MPESRELGHQECQRLLRAGVVGRVALSTPEGPHIVPVGYTVMDDTIVIGTSAYSVLGSYVRNTMLAFEVDHVDPERHVGWSVVARGRGWVEVDPEEISRIRQRWQARPWASGRRNVYVRIRWDSLTGRALDAAGWNHDREGSAPHTLSSL